MNKKLIYSAIVCLGLSMSSCNDFLDVEPPAGFTPEYLFESEDEINSLITNVYSAMTRDQIYGCLLYTSDAADE